MPRPHACVHLQAIYSAKHDRHIMILVVRPATASCLNQNCGTLALTCTIVVTDESTGEANPNSAQERLASQA